MGWSVFQQFSPIVCVDELDAFRVLMSHGFTFSFQLELVILITLVLVRSEKYCSELEN